VLISGTGTGKSHLAIAIARACIRGGARGRFFTVVDPPVTHTHALFAEQSYSIPDNLVALLGDSRAWNCSDPQRLIRSTFAKIKARIRRPS
jgi:hypothetical protein